MIDDSCHGPEQALRDRGDLMWMDGWADKQNPRGDTIFTRFDQFEALLSDHCGGERRQVGDGRTCVGTRSPHRTSEEHSN